MTGRRPKGGVGLEVPRDAARVASLLLAIPLLGLARTGKVDGEGRMIREDHFLSLNEGGRNGGGLVMFLHASS